MSTIEDNRHDYEPGDSTHAMHSDRMCAVCGLARSAAVHTGS